jgi:putative ABC transport system ATP-binding protein
MLELCQIAKRYPATAGGSSVAALDEVDLRLARGEFLAVTGPSGSGKSTLLLIAGGLLTPSSGRVSFDGRDVHSLTAEARARWRVENVGFVFQQIHLIPYLSVCENILAPTLGLATEDAPRRAQELIERFRLGHRRNHVPAALSAGEQQRVAMARALLHRPKLLLCDEPTGNLDEQNSVAVMDCLAEFQRQGGAVLLVTHHGGAAARAGRRLQLRDGRLALEATPAAVI